MPESKAGCSCAILICLVLSALFTATFSPSEVKAVFAQSQSVESTAPYDGQRRISIETSINATFSRSMNASTINEQSFGLQSESGQTITGSVTYDSDSSRATFLPQQVLDFGEVYTASLTADIEDDQGNPIEPTNWTFTTGGRIRIGLLDLQNDEFLAGSAFTVTPNPFSLAGSLTVEDNGPFDSNSNDGIIFIDNVENNFTTYLISESTIPDGYSRIYGDSIVSVVQTNTCGVCSPASVLTVQNIPQSLNITDFGDLILVARPDLNRTQFEIYRNNVIVGEFSGVQGNIGGNTVEITGPDRGFLPLGYLATNNTLDEAPVTESFNFRTTASPSLSGAEIIDSFDVPTYPGPVEDIAPFMIYAVPALVIPYEGSANNFVLTPVIDKIYPGLTLLLNQSSYVDSNVAAIRQVQMTFNVEATGAGLSFGISNSPPPGTPAPALDVPALFLDVGFVGDVNFSDASIFKTSPTVDVIVNKTISGFNQLADGCSDFKVLLFNEQTKEWNTVEQLRNPKFDTESQCGFTLHPEHFSKFAVGGVKGQDLSTNNPPPHDVEDVNRGKHGGGSSSTAITQPAVGDNVATTIQTQSGTVQLRFESIANDSGQLKINSYELSHFRNIVDDIVFLQDGNEHGIINAAGTRYFTMGEVYDIDASSVKFEGEVDVTIPYDESVAKTYGPESNVRFLHFDASSSVWEDVTKAVHDNANTVTGTVEDLSPVTAAVVRDGGSGTSALDNLNGSKLFISEPTFTLSGSGNLLLSANIQNVDRSKQDFVMIVELLDDQGVVQYLDWQTGSVDANHDASGLTQWGHIRKGNYTAKIFLLTELNDPQLLSGLTAQIEL